MRERESMRKTEGSLEQFHFRVERNFKEPWVKFPPLELGTPETQGYTGARSPEGSFSPRARPFLCWEGASRSKLSHHGWVWLSLSALSRWHSRAPAPLGFSGCTPQLACTPRSLQTLSKPTVLERGCGWLVPGSCLHPSSSLITERWESNGSYGSSSPQSIQIH